MNQPLAKGLSRRGAAAVIVALVLGQAAMGLLTFRSFDDATNGRPILNVDFCSQYYWAHAARQFQDRDQRMWGYDPHFMAGYPLDFVFNSALPVQLAAVTFPEANLARVIKTVFMLSLLLVPLTLYHGVRQFGIERGPALAAAALGLAYFWAGENSFFAHLGMISGAFLLHFCLVPIGLAFRFLRFGQNRAYVLLSFALAASLTIHKTAAVLVFAPVLILVLFDAGRLSRRAMFMLAGALAFAALANLHWLYPFFKFLPLKVEDPGTTFFQNTDLLRWLKDLAPIPPWQPLFATALLRLIIVSLGVAGLMRLWRQERGTFWRLGLLLGFMGLFSYFGSLVPQLRHLQPYRYLSAYFYLWLPAAAYGLQALGARVSGPRFGSIWGPAAYGASLVGVLLLPSFLMFSTVARLTTTLDRDSQNLVDWVNNRTDGSARVLIEDINVWDVKPGQGALYGGARLVHLLPLLTSRELIGGPLPNAFILHHYAGFHDGRFLGQSIGEMSDRELDEAMGNYNIGWVVCWTEESVKRFRSYDPAKWRDTFGRIEVFEVERDRNFFLEGQGRVESGFNRLKLSGLVSEGGRVVISYHWVDGLEAAPPARLTRVFKGDDPAGFIGIEDPPPGLTISLGP